MSWSILQVVKNLGHFFLIFLASFWCIWLVIALWYRYHGDWRSETQIVVSLLTFMHWLETGNLLMHTEAQEKLGCMFFFYLVYES